MKSVEKIFITGNPRKSELKKIFDRFLVWIKPMGIKVDVDSNLSEHINPSFKLDTYSINDLSSDMDLIMAFGGDGTILYTANATLEKEIPILGINLGGLGFLADINIDQLSHAIEHIVHNDYEVEKRNVLEIKNSSSKTSRYAVNDIIFDKAGYQRVIEIRVSADNTYINGYIADGLIISTPTGSTGYNISSGGPIVVPGTDVNIINPICPHSLTARPLIIAASETIKVKVNTESDSFRVNADGQIYGDFSSGTEFEIIKSRHPLKLIKIKGHDIFTILRNKLRWGHDFRNKNRWSYNS